MPKTANMPEIKNIIDVLIIDTKDLQMQYARLMASTLSQAAADKFNSCNNILDELEKLKKQNGLI